MISSLKNGNISFNKRYSVVQIISKINSILSSRNTISFREKPNYLSLAYILSNRNNINYNSIKDANIAKNNDKNDIKNAQIIQNWWRKRKKYYDEKIKKIIKIQSVWRGINSRKFIYDIMYLCYLCQTFYNILWKTLTHNARLFIWNILLSKKNEKSEKLKKVKKLFSRYRFLKPYFKKWKYNIKNLLIINKAFNKKKIIKTKINIINVNDLKRKYFREWIKIAIRRKFLNKTNNIIRKKYLLNFNNKNINQEKEKNKLLKEFIIHLNSKNNEMDKLRSFYKWKNKKDEISNLELKILFLNSIYLKMYLNRIRTAFDYLNKYHLNNYEILRNTNNKININENTDNNIFLKRYYLFRWRNQVKSISISELKKKILIYIINNISRKSALNMKYKYFSRWKLYTDDYFNNINKLKNIQKKGDKLKQRKKRLLSLLSITANIKIEFSIIFLRELIRKWRFLIFAKKMAREKMLKRYEVMQKTYCKMTEEIYDFDRQKEEKYNILNNNNYEDEKKFVEQINKLYNEKHNQKFKFRYNGSNINKFSK